MPDHPITSQSQWLEVRKELLAKEKAFTKLRDELSQLRRELPWVEVSEQYWFEGKGGSRSLNDLFGDHSQLIIFHFMFGPNWEEGCPSCSFWADNFEGIPVHLAHRDAAFAAISRAPYEKLSAYQKRMGWTFPWYSSADNNFNFDFHVSFSQEQIETGEAEYNYRKTNILGELPGISVFCRGEHGEIYHSYSTYARGLDMLNGAYHLMDILPKGRDESDLPRPMAWLRRHDQY